MSSQLRAPLAVLLGLAMAATCRADVAGDEAQLKASGVPTDGPGLLSYFKKRTLADDTRANVARLVRQLGADEWATREDASHALEDLGGLVRPQVAPATHDADPEIRRRARRVLTRLGPAAAENNLYPVAARVLAERKPAGAAEVLLNFLPCVEDVEVAEEVARALPALAMVKPGKVDPALAAALTDRFAVKRYSAAEALISAGGPAHRGAARKLLADADPGVRRRVAVALFHARDRAAVPVLLDLLKSAPGEDADAAEDALTALAGDASPTPPAGDSPADRARHVKGWENWWKEKGPRIDLARADLTVGGRHTLVALINNNVMGGRRFKGGWQTGTVMELDNAGKVRWEINDLQYPVHVSKHRRDRILVCEYQGNRVTERDTAGKVLWERNANGQIVSAQRLANGNTFIVTRNQMQEVDAKGNEVQSIPRPMYDCLSANKMKDGKILMISSTGSCVKLDAAGKELSRFNVGAINAPLGFNAHFLRRGGVVVPDYGNSKVREYDASGKLVWEAAVAYPNSVARLPNGNTLVAPRTGSHLIELNKAGKEVSRRQLKGMPMFVDRR